MVRTAVQPKHDSTQYGKEESEHLKRTQECTLEKPVHKAEQFHVAGLPQIKSIDDFRELHMM